MAHRPIGEHEQNHQQMEEMWDRLTGGNRGRPHFSRPVLEPPVDVYETAENVVILAEIAGIGSQDVRIEVLRDRLRFAGQRDDHHAAVGHRHSQMEIPYGAFERTVNLPAEVDAAGVELFYQDGFLRIVLPKRQPQTHHVRVTVRARRP